MPVPTDEAAAVGRVADPFRTASHRELAEVGTSSNARSDDQVVHDDEVEAEAQLASDGHHRIRLSAVERPVGELRDRDGPIDGDHRAERAPQHELSPASRHHFHADFGGDEVSLPVDEAVEAVRRHVGRVEHRLLTNQVVVVEAREEPPGRT